MKNFLLPIIISYFVGCIPFSYLVGKYLGGVDIRKHGSGNSGATNVLRTLGKKAGIIAFIGDFLKGLIIVLSTKYIFDLKIAILSSVFVVLGHCYSVFLNFKGGKGVATSAGTIFGLFPLIGLILLIIQIVVIKLYKMMSLASIIVALSFPLISIVLKAPKEFIIYSITMGLFVVYKHKSNIKRLISGTEKKISFK